MAASRFSGTVKSQFLKFSTIPTIKIELKLDLKFDFLSRNVMLSKWVYLFIKYLRVGT